MLNPHWVASGTGRQSCCSRARSMGMKSMSGQVRYTRPLRSYRYSDKSCMHVCVYSRACVCRRITCLITYPSSTHGRLGTAAHAFCTHCVRGPHLYCYDRLAVMRQADVVRTSINRATRRIYIPGICHVTLTVIDIGTHANEYIRRVSSVAAGCILAELLGQAPLFPGNDSWQSASAHNRAPTWGTEGP